jgi:hypothetical protein
MKNKLLIERFQKLAGIKPLKEEVIFADFSAGGEEGSLEQKFARVASEELHTYGAQDNLTIDDLYSTGEMAVFINGDPEGFYASKAESLKVYQSLPPVFTITNNIASGTRDQGSEEETFTITKNEDGSFSATGGMQDQMKDFMTPFTKK